MASSQPDLDGAGGFSPGVPLGCLGAANAGRSGGVLGL